MLSTVEFINLVDTVRYNVLAAIAREKRMSDAIRIDDLTLYPNEYYWDTTGKRFRVVYDPIENNTTCAVPWDIADHPDYYVDSTLISAHNPGTIVQNPSVKNNTTPVYKRVMADIEDRASLGCEKYGTYLQTFNGRDALIDLYQEMLDAVQYLRQRIDEDYLKEELDCNESIR